MVVCQLGSLYMELKVIQIGNIVDDTNIGFKNPQRGRVYSIEGLAPTMQNFSGGCGLQPKIVVEDDREKEDNNSRKTQCERLAQQGL